jgi:GT2 family glycosyltransferase
MKENKPFVCVIVLNYDGKNYLQKCLPSLESHLTQTIQ